MLVHPRPEPWSGSQVRKEAEGIAESTGPEADVADNRTVVLIFVSNLEDEAVKKEASLSH